MTELEEKITLLADILGIRANTMEEFREQCADYKKELYGTSVKISQQLERNRELSEEMKKSLQNLDTRLANQ